MEELILSPDKPYRTGDVSHIPCILLYRTTNEAPTFLRIALVHCLHTYTWTLCGQAHVHTRARAHTHTHKHTQNANKIFIFFLIFLLDNVTTAKLNPLVSLCWDLLTQLCNYLCIDDRED